MAPVQVVGKSQPKACDPVFNAWRRAGGLTPDLTWRRIALAMTKILALRRYAIQRQSHIVLDVRIPILIDGQTRRGVGTKNVAHAVRDITLSNHSL